MGGGAEAESSGKCAEETRKDFAAAGVVTEFCTGFTGMEYAICCVRGDVMRRRLAAQYS